MTKNLKNKLEKIDSEQFKAAVKQLKLGKMKSANEFIERMKMQVPNNKLNVARIGYLVGLLLISHGKFEDALGCFVCALDRLLGLEAEKKS